jgi:hypothetical protein
MTQNSYSNMLNEQTGKSPAAELSAERERVRNVLIDRTGRKPTEQEIDQFLALAAQGKQAGNAPAENLYQNLL